MRRRTRTAVSAGVLTIVSGLLLVACGGRDHVALELRPAFALRDAPLAITVTGLRSGERVRIVGEETHTSAVQWRGSLNERADASGRVRLSDAPLLSLMGPRAAVLVLGGSEGGLSTISEGSLLAAHGHPALALAYFGEPGLPAQLHDIPLEYFQRALRWLRQRPEVAGRRIVVLGASFGGEAALLIGSTYPQLVGGVAAYVPFDIVSPAPADPGVAAWTLHSRPVTPGKPIPVQKIDGPVFAVGSYGDRLWPSGVAVADLEFELKGHTPKPTLFDFDKPGHAIGAILPNVSTGTHVSSRYGELNLGGGPVIDERAREQTWPKLLAWLKRVQ